MTYVFSLAHLAGTDDAQRLAEHGVEALTTLFHDDVDGGWFDEVGFGWSMSRLRAGYGGGRVETGRVTLNPHRRAG